MMWPLTIRLTITTVESTCAVAFGEGRAKERSKLDGRDGLRGECADAGREPILRKDLSCNAKVQDRYAEMFGGLRGG